MTYDFCEELFSDLYKDAYGSRPTADMWRQWEDAPDSVKQDIWDTMMRDLAAEDARREQEYVAAVQQLEAHVQRNMDLGAPDRDTAIRWIIQSLDLSEDDMRYGGSYVCYKLGLPYDMASNFTPIMEGMSQ